LDGKAGRRANTLSNLMEIPTVSKEQAFEFGIASMLFISEKVFKVIPCALFAKKEAISSNIRIAMR